jgi:hypothetical protein
MKIPFSFQKPFGKPKGIHPDSIGIKLKPAVEKPKI